MVFEYLWSLHLPQGVGLSSAAREVERDVKKGKHVFLLVRSEKCDYTTHFADEKAGLKKIQEFVKLLPVSWR